MKIFSGPTEDEVRERATELSRKLEVIERDTNILRSAVASIEDQRQKHVYNLQHAKQELKRLKGVEDAHQAKLRELERHAVILRKERDRTAKALKGFTQDRYNADDAKRRQVLAEQHAQHKANREARQKMAEQAKAGELSKVDDSGDRE